MDQGFSWISYDADLACEPRTLAHDQHDKVKDWGTLGLFVCLPTRALS